MSDYIFPEKIFYRYYALQLVLAQRTIYLFENHIPEFICNIRVTLLPFEDFLKGVWL